jgi:hypothetical protein
VTCTWPAIYPAECAALTDAVDPLIFEQMAIDFLSNWTGGLYGLCPVVIRPCRSDCGGSVDAFWGFGPYTRGSSMPRRGRWGPALIGGAWFNLSCGTCGDDCSCGLGAPSLRLPGPVSSVEEVLIDGTPLPASAYRVDNHSLLVRLDGQGWPACQDMAAPVTAANTWQVSYTRGTEVPVGGQVAAGALACELAKAATNDRTCQLPQRVQTIARQGVTVQLLDMFTDVEKGGTGIWVVDSWVASVTKSPRHSKVYSPDIPHPRHRVTTWP